MIHIVTALACEANPIIQHYHLRKSMNAHGFPVYRNKTITLIISGMGKFAAASAVGYLQALSNSAADDNLTQSVPHSWFNVGIAGHKTFELGTAVLAHRVSDAAAQQRFYPSFTFDLPCVSTDVISVEQAETTYTMDAAYDMEALGFCAAASRFSSFELIHCLKIISDNLTNSHEHITKHVGEELVGNQLLVIENLLDEFEKLQQVSTAIVVPSEDYQLLTDQFRFTVTQQNQLRRLLQRWRVLEHVRFTEQFPLQNFRNAKQVLQALESHLQTKVFVC
ncbi:5'-methylthioadenosine/S-adenosylhomocysteine nucleosidase family protein [Kaarinaea lacus]